MSNPASGFHHHQSSGGRAAMLSFARDKNPVISSSFPSQRLPPFLQTDSDACTSGLRSSSSSTAVMATAAVAGLTTSPCRRVSYHVRLLWTALSVMVTAGCTYSFMQPAWYINGRSRDGLGLYNYCIRDVARSAAAAAAAARFTSSAIRWSSANGGSQPSNVQYQMCGVYGGNQFDLSSLPSNAWQIACVLYGGGCVLLGFGSVAAVVSLVLPNVWSTRLASYTGYIQTMAAVILIGAVVSFPVGLDSKFAQHYCPGARMYNAGSCQVGWAYILGIMTSALVVFCPVLSNYTDIDDVMETDADHDDVIAGNTAMAATSTVRLIA